MSMQMHVLHAMYAPTDWLTLMVMGMYIEKEMDHITYMGDRGTTRRGSFKVKTDGIGDTSLSGLIRLHDDGIHRFHLNAGVSFPTGSNSKTHEILTPLGTRPVVTRALRHADRLRHLGPVAWDYLHRRPG